MRIACIVIAVVFVAAAIFHATAIAIPSIAGGVGPARHAAFVAINMACAVVFVRRPRGAAWVFAVLVVQQMFSHGSDAWHAWREGRVDVVSLVVLVVMPAALFLLARTPREAREQEHPTK